jgi:hypothetical protein
LDAVKQRTAAGATIADLRLGRSGRVLKPSANLLAPMLHIQQIHR